MEHGSTDKLEAEALRTPQVVRSWLLLIRALDERNRSSAHGHDVDPMKAYDAVTRGLNRINETFERALVHNAYSYKLWAMYLAHRIAQWDTICCRRSAEMDGEIGRQDSGALLLLNVRFRNSIVKLFERALARLPTMPLLWTKLLEFLSTPPSSHVASSDAFAAPSQPPVMFSRFRVALLDALHALPITQHTIVWNVFRKWVATLRLDDAPFGPLHAMWQLLLQGNSSDRAMGEYVQFLVRCRQNAVLLRYVCTLGQWSSARAKLVLPRMCHDSVFWDLIDGVLLSTKVEQHGARGEDICVDALVRFILEGRVSSLQPDRLVLSLGVFLMRRGAFTVARRILRDVIEQTSNAATFQDAFVVLVRMEQQLIDCVALDDAAVAQIGDASALEKFLRQRIFSTTEQAADEQPWNPVDHLATLAHDYPLLLNAVQLRQKPHDARLWLKRVECLYERAAARGLPPRDPQTQKDVEEVLSQGIALCKRTSSSASSPPPLDGTNYRNLAEMCDVSALYVAWGDLLVADKRFQEAIALLRRAAFSVAFSSLDANTRLFGLLVEALTLSHATVEQPTAAAAGHIVYGTAPPSDDVAMRVLSALMDIIRSELDTMSSHANGARINAGQMFLHGRGTRTVAAAVLHTQSLWDIAWDVVFWAEGPRGKFGDELAGWMGALGLYTPAVALLRAEKLREKSQFLEAFLLLEDALNRCQRGGVSASDAAKQHGRSYSAAAAALLLADAAAASVLDHIHHSINGSATDEVAAEGTTAGGGASARTENSGGKSAVGASSLTVIQRHLCPRRSTPDSPAQIHVALLVEKLRAVLRQGLEVAREAALVLPLRALTFYFCAAACEECLGLYGNCIRTLQEAVRTFFSRMHNNRRGGPAAAEKPLEGGSLDGAHEDEEELWFLKGVEVLAQKVLLLRGSDALFNELAQLLKLKMSPRCICEVALRLTAELAKARLVDKCRAVFSAVAPLQNPSAAEPAGSVVAPTPGEIFWGAWASFERDFGTEATFTSTQRTKRNVQASFSKCETKFENQ